MEKKLVEVEGQEMAIFSTKGIMAIIPKNKVNWVKRKLNEGCHECIDEFVKTLPDFDNNGQKAEDGVVLGTDPPPTEETDPPKRRDPNQKFYESETIPETYQAQYLLPEVGVVAERPKSAIRRAMANLNPKNWFVEDYSNYNTRDEAYAAARQAGEPEFMYNGERFNTKMAGTPQQQLQWSGITDERIHDRSFQEKRLGENLDPFSYEDMVPRYLDAVVMNRKDPKRLEREEAPEEYQDRPYMGPRTDAFNLYTGIPQKYNSFSVSDYTPTRGDDKDAMYYSINMLKKPAIARDMVSRYEGDINFINDQLAFRKLDDKRIAELKEKYLYRKAMKQEKVLPVGVQPTSAIVGDIRDYIDYVSKEPGSKKMPTGKMKQVQDLVSLMNEPELANRMEKGEISEEDLKTLIEIKEFSDVMSSYDPKTRSMMYEDTGAGVMGNYHVSKGVDPETGREYISYHDVWDIAPKDFGKPFNIYDRIYLDELNQDKK